MDLNYKNNLEVDLQSLEIKQVLFSMAAWKSHGLDGFPAGFYKGTWHITGESLCSFIKSSWKKEISIVEVNYTEICLIPKIPSP